MKLVVSLALALVAVNPVTAQCDYDFCSGGIKYPTAIVNPDDAVANQVPCSTIALGISAGLVTADQCGQLPLLEYVCCPPGGPIACGNMTIDFCPGGLEDPNRIANPSDPVEDHSPCGFIIPLLVLGSIPEEDCETIPFAEFSCCPPSIGSNPTAAPGDDSTLPATDPPTAAVGGNFVPFTEAEFDWSLPEDLMPFEPISVFAGSSITFNYPGDSINLVRNPSGTCDGTGSEVIGAAGEGSVTYTFDDSQIDTVVTFTTSFQNYQYCNFGMILNVLVLAPPPSSSPSPTDPATLGEPISPNPTDPPTLGEPILPDPTDNPTLGAPLSPEPTTKPTVVDTLATEEAVLDWSLPDDLQPYDSISVYARGTIRFEYPGTNINVLRYPSGTCEDSTGSELIGAAGEGSATYTFTEDQIDTVVTFATDYWNYCSFGMIINVLVLEPPPSAAPSGAPSGSPTVSPVAPTELPSIAPTPTTPVEQPTMAPLDQPTTAPVPTEPPVLDPTETNEPTMAKKTKSPTSPTTAPAVPATTSAATVAFQLTRYVVLGASILVLVACRGASFIVKQNGGMVNWSGIEDIDALPTRIWLCREKETDQWLPLRHKDCQALNKTPDQPVVIENGRAIADPTWGKIRYNYIKGEMFLTSATWFMKTEDENDKKAVVLIPMEERDALVVEQLYQDAVYAASSFGKGINSIDRQLPFVDGKYRVELTKQSGQYMMRKVPIGWFARSYDLQRGYGAYTLEGEDDEDQLGPVNHVLFVVHGIGEALFNKDDIKFMLTMKEEMTKFRMQIQKRQIETWKKTCDIAKKKGTPRPPPPNRVEVVPIIWYDRIHSSSNELMQSLQATTLNTIPALREIANDVVFDILMYMTPNFCYDVLECVTDQIISSYNMFKKNNPDFESSGGKCSLIGHSLGSVICWDLLSILKENQTSKKDEHGVHITKDGYSSDVGYQQYASTEVNKSNRSDYGSWGPSLPKSLDRHLPFEPDFALFLGSPLGQFLTLRGAHPVFDELRKTEGENTEISPFTLPCSSVHNVFSPSDVVAYRIEPLLLPRGTTDIPPPVYLTAQGQGVRLHVKARHIGDDIRKNLEDTRKSVNVFMAGLREQASSILQQMDERNGGEAKRAKKEEGEGESNGPLTFPLAGKQLRLDFQLQPNLIDNEYISAVTAHSSYWGNTDVMDYVIDLTKNEEPPSDTAMIEAEKEPVMSC